MSFYTWQNNKCNKYETLDKIVISATTTSPPYDCRRALYGCCRDRYTPKRDEFGTNCPGW